MDNFDLKKYLAENRQPIQEIDAPYDIIQSTLKNLAGYWPVDIKNNLDNLGAEEFKKRLDNLKPYIDQYFKKDNEGPTMREGDEEDEYEDDSYTTHCDLCDMPSTYSDDTPYGTCMCS